MNTHTSKNHTNNMLRTPKENIPLGRFVFTEDGRIGIEVKFKGRKEIIFIDWLIEMIFLFRSRYAPHAA